jgi:type II secretory pathway pseudopilin PulG
VTFVVFSILASAAIWSWRGRIRKQNDEIRRNEAARRRQEVWAGQYEALLAGRVAQAAPPAPVRNGRAHFTIEPTLP